jgi:hypothetical protein
VQCLLVFSFGLLATQAHAVWEYPIEAQLAILDAVVNVCGPIMPAEARAYREKFESRQSAAIRSQFPQIRAGRGDYLEVLKGSTAEARKQVSGSPASQRKACAMLLKN